MNFYVIIDISQDKFCAASVGVKGSGWGWLGYCPKGDKVAVASCQNQDPLQSTHGRCSIFNLYHSNYNIIIMTYSGMCLQCQ